MSKDTHREKVPSNKTQWVSGQLLYQIKYL